MAYLMGHFGDYSVTREFLTKTFFCRRPHFHDIFLRHFGDDDDFDGDEETPQFVFVSHNRLVGCLSLQLRFRTPSDSI